MERIRLTPLRGGALAAAVLLVLGIRAALPAWLERVLVDQIERGSGLQAEIDDLDLGVLRGVARIEGLRLSSAAPGGPTLGIGSLHANLEWLDLLSGELHLREIAISTPALALSRGEDGRLIGVGTPREEGVTEAKARDGPWRVAVDRLQIRDLGVRVAESDRDARVLATLDLRRLELVALRVVDGAVAIGDIDFEAPELSFASEDWDSTPDAHRDSEAAVSTEATGDREAEAAPAFALQEVAIRDARIRVGNREPLELHLDVRASGLSSAPGHRSPIEFALKSGPGHLSSAGWMALSPLAFRGNVHWSALDLEALGAALEGLPVRVESGTTTGSLDVAVDTAATATLRGNVEIATLDVADPEEGFAAAASALTVEALSLELPIGPGPAGPSVALGEVVLSDPRVQVRRRPPEPGTRLDETPSVRDSADGTPLALSIETIRFQGGRFEWIDEGLEADREIVLEEVRGDAAGLRFPRRGTGFDSMHLDARVASGGELRIRGSSSPASSLLVEGFDLRALRGYAREAGYALREGTLDLESRGVFRADTLSLENRVLIGGLSVDNEGGRFEAAVGVPLDVALALLRDPAGNIGLQVPVSVRPGETDLHLAATLRSALRQALVGALTTPLKAAGFLIPGEGPLLAIPSGAVGVTARRLTLPFPADDATIGTGERDRLESLASFLRERPGVRVRVEGRAAETEQAVNALPAVGAETPPSLLERAAGVFGIGGDDDPTPAEGAGEQGDRGAALATKRAEAVSSLLTGALAVPEAQLQNAPVGSGGAEVVLELEFP